MREQKDIRYTIVDGFDFIIDEKGNKTLNLRKLYYGDKEENVKLDLRQWFNGSDGGENMGKGTSFLTEEGPHTLVDIMTKNGYGDTKTVLQNLSEREDFRPSLNSVLGKDDENYDDSISEDEEETVFYDPREMLFN